MPWNVEHTDEFAEWYDVYIAEIKKEGLIP
jgi:hypothetical protein